MRALVACLLLVGCNDAVTPGEEIVGQSCEREGAARESWAAEGLDVAIVVSDAASMAAYRDALVANLREGANVIANADCGPFSLQIAIVDGQGDVSVVQDIQRPWFWCDAAPCDFPSYAGTLADALATRAPSEFTGPAQPLLDVFEQAFPPHRFFREDSEWTIVFVDDADDTSIDAPAAYAARLRARRDDPHITVDVVGGPRTPRFDALLSAFPSHSNRGSIDQDEWDIAWVMARLGCPRSGGGCVPDADSCVVSAPDGAAIPPCLLAAPMRPDPSTPLPCYWIDTSNEICAGDGIVVERMRFDRQGSLTRCACDPVP